MIVFPMAGESSRFIQAGYKTKKFMLHLGEGFVFDYVLFSFEKYFSSDKFIFISLLADNARQFIEDRCAVIGITDFQVIELQSATDGQASTVAEGLTRLRPSDDCVFIFNIDTIMVDWSKPPWIEECDGFLDVFEAAGDAWSFVEPDPKIRGVVIRTAEKERISPLCSTGMYFFKSSEYYLQVYAGSTSSDLVRGEKYIAPLYNRVIGQGGDVRYRHIGPHNIYSAGIPQDYENLRMGVNAGVILKGGRLG